MGLRSFLAIVELRTKVVSVTSFALGTLCAVYVDGGFSWPVAALMLAAVLCIDMGTTAFNSFFDYDRRVDDEAFNREEDKVLVHRGVAPGWALIAGLGLFALGSLLGLVLAWLRGFGVLLVGGVGMAAGFFYNFGRRPISHTPFGELAAGGFLGAVLFLLSYFVQAGRLSPQAWLSALPLFFLVASILTTNNTCDIDGDRAAGRRTLAIVLGRKRGEALVITLGAAAYALAAAQIAAGALPRWAGLTLAASLAFTVVTWTRMHRLGYSHQTKGPSMGAITRVLAAYGLAAVAALATGLLLR